MNEQIKQIALQARLGPVLLLEHWGNIDALTDSEQQQLKEIEQFAELIIHKCLQICDKVSDTADINTKNKFLTKTAIMLHKGLWAGAKDCHWSIGDYFGVK